MFKEKTVVQGISLLLLLIYNHEPTTTAAFAWKSQYLLPPFSLMTGSEPREPPLSSSPQPQKQKPMSKKVLFFQPPHAIKLSSLHLSLCLIRCIELQLLLISLDYLSVSNQTSLCLSLLLLNPFARSRYTLSLLTFDCQFLSPASMIPNPNYLEITRTRPVIHAFFPSSPWLLLINDHASWLAVVVSFSNFPTQWIVYLFIYIFG